MARFARLKRWLLTILVIILGCCAISQIFLYWARQPIPSREELCQALSEQMEWSACLAHSSVSGLVHEAFPPGVTTRAEVHQAIGQYRIGPETYEVYGLNGTWLSRNLDFSEDTYHFGFDKDDKLLSISVQS